MRHAASPTTGTQGSILPSENLTQTDSVECSNGREIKNPINHIFIDPNGNFVSQLWVGRPQLLSLRKIERVGVKREREIQRDRQTGADRERYREREREREGQKERERERKTDTQTGSRLGGEENERERGWCLWLKPRALTVCQGWTDRVLPGSSSTSQYKVSSQHQSAPGLFGLQIITG